jgi:hypothetical protein
MLALQLSAIAVGIGFTFKHPVFKVPIFSITLICYNHSVTLGVNGYLM